MAEKPWYEIVGHEELSKALADPALADLKDGPAKELLTRLASQGYMEKRTLLIFDAEKDAVIVNSLAGGLSAGLGGS